MDLFDWINLWCLQWKINSFNKVIMCITWLFCLQERELKVFRDGQKVELKRLKEEVDILPKEARKDALRRRREEKEIEHAEKVRFSSSTGKAQVVVQVRVS